MNGSELLQHILSIGNERREENSLVNLSINRSIQTVNSETSFEIFNLHHSKWLQLGNVLMDFPFSILHLIFKSNLRRNCGITPKCDESLGLHPWLSSWAMQLRKNVAAVASRQRHSVPFDRPGNQTPGLPH